MRTVLVLCLAAPLLLGQSEKVVDRGVVKAQGRILPGVTVTAERAGTKVAVASDDNGVYEIALEPGEWKFTVELFGFEPATRTLTLGSGAPPADWDLRIRSLPAGLVPRPGTPAAQAAAEGAEPQLPSLPEPDGAPLPPVADFGTQGTNESFLVSGSMSQGMPPALADAPPGGFFAGALGMGGPGQMGAESGPANPFGQGAAEGQPAGPGFAGRVGPGGGPGGPGGPGMGGPGRPGMGGPGFGPGGGPRGGPGGPGGPGAMRGRGPMAGRPGLGGPGSPEGFGGPRERSEEPQAQTAAKPGKPGKADKAEKKEAKRELPRFARSGQIGNRANRANRTVLRGMLSFQARNSAWNARPYSLTGLEYDRPDQSQYRFSATAGGLMPKLGPGTMLTFSYDYRNERRAFNGVATVPTAAERAGDFSNSVTNLPVTIYDPASGLPFAGNRIPASRINSAAKGLLEFLPLANLDRRIQNYQFVTGVPQNTNQLSVRVNRPFSRKDRLGANFQFQDRDGEQAQLFGFLDGNSGRGFTNELTWTRNLSQRVIQNLSLRFQRNTSRLTPFFAGTRNVAAELGIEGTAQDPDNWGPPNLSFTNFGALRDGAPSFRRDLQLRMAARWSVVRGKHSVAFGGDMTRLQLNLRTDQNARGTFTFSGLATSRADNGVPAPATGFDFADFLLGLPQSSSLRFGSSSNYFRAWNRNLFVQDDWRLRRNFSVTLGLRYEWFGPMGEKFGRLANLDIAPGFLGAAVVLPGAVGPYGGRFPDTLVDADKNNLSPRLGVAWKASEKRRLTVRAGYGWYYNGSIYQNFATRLASQPPFAETATVNTAPGRVLTIQNGFSARPSQSITNTFAVDRSYLVGYAQTWSFNVQKEYGRGYVLEAGILGTKGTRLDTLRSPNRAAPGSPLTSEQRRLIGNAVGFTWDSSEANSIYHAAQLRVSRRFNRGVSFSGLYTFGKSIDNASSIGGVGNTVAQDDRNLAAERGLSSFNRPHTLNLSWVYASLVRDRTPGVWAAMARGWTVSGSLSAQSGTPLTPRVLGNRSDSNGTGVVGSGRADATGLPVASGEGFFNLAAFAVPPGNRFGNAARNSIPGPGLLAVNASLMRGFRVGDGRRRLELTLEGNNITNRVSFSTLGTTVNASNYGLPLGTAPMRTVQMQARFRF